MGWFYHDSDQLSSPFIAIDQACGSLSTLSYSKHLWVDDLSGLLGQRCGDQGLAVGPLVGDLSMAVDGLAGRLEGVKSVRQACTNHAGQHITSPRRGQSGVTGGVDHCGLPGCCDDGARAFEYHGAAKALRQLLNGRQAVVLYLGCTAAQEACGFQGMGCEHGGSLTPATSA